MALDPHSRSSTSAGIEVRIEGLRRRYGPITAVDGLDMTLAPGELVALLGPSGCGKTTTLRLVAGLEAADGGRVLFGGRDVSRLAPSRRGAGMVFQQASLFVHMTARGNVAFGLRGRSLEPGSRERRVNDLLELVGLPGVGGRRAHQLSGGEQQRVALARALATRPDVLLLDEPLSALDAPVRAQLRDEIRRVQVEVGTTTLLVTHDQEEALSIADRVAVMRAGRLEQVGEPVEVYSRPASPFVAEFVGLTSRLAGVIRDGRIEVRGTWLPLVDPAAPAGPAAALVRAEAIGVAPAEDGAAGPLVGVVTAAAFLGATTRLSVDLGDETVVAQLPSVEAGSHPAGRRVRLTLRPDPVTVAADLAEGPGDRVSEV